MRGVFSFISFCQCLSLLNFIDFNGHECCRLGALYLCHAFLGKFVITSELFCDQVDTPFVAFELVCRLAQWFCVLLGMSNITLRMIFCFGMVESEDLKYGRKLET